MINNYFQHLHFCMYIPKGHATFATLFLLDVFNCLCLTNIKHCLVVLLHSNKLFLKTPKKNIVFQQTLVRVIGGVGVVYVDINMNIDDC